MPTIIFNANQINFGNKETRDTLSIHEQQLAFHIGQCLQRIPPKQLCRCLRESFLLRWEELQQTTPDFNELVTEMLVLFARLDAEEDRLAGIV